jgi:hypothetical protein
MELIFSPAATKGLLKAPAVASRCSLQSKRPRMLPRSSPPAPGTRRSDESRRVPPICPKALAEAVGMPSGIWPGSRVVGRQAASLGVATDVVPSSPT